MMEYTKKTLKAQENLKKILKFIDDYEANTETQNPYEIDRLLFQITIETESALHTLED